jgi:Domain of unknown function (DUF4331)
VRKLVTLAVMGLVMSAQVFGLAAFPAGAADHLDGPLAASDGRLDINDIYVFHPGDAGSQDLSKTVFVMTVNPGAGVISGENFANNATYEFKLDYDGDAVEDARILTRFTGVRKDGSQRYETRFIQNGNIPPRGKIASGSTGVVNEGRTGARAYAGLLDDPFFFDLNGFNAGAMFTGDDFFAGLNVSALVIEIPTAWITSDNVGVWAETWSRSRGRIDRMGRPGINTVFIPQNPFEPNEPSEKDAFNLGDPADDQANFRDEIVDTLTVLYSLNDNSGDDPSDDAATIQAIANILLPDVLTVDLSVETAFLNGRGLADDVIDAELGLITEGLITSDGVDSNDASFQAEFPYLAPAN